MPRLAITDEQRTTEVDLWGSLFEVVGLTKANEEDLLGRLAEVNAKIDKAENHSDLLGFLAEKFDIQLTPAGGGRKKASTLLKEKWDAGEITVTQAIRFLRRIEELEIRPT